MISVNDCGFVVGQTYQARGGHTAVVVEHYFNGGMKVIHHDKGLSKEEDHWPSGRVYLQTDTARDLLKEE